MYGGKFFVKYSFSLNLLPLGLDMNPMMIKRNYGTEYLTMGGKTHTKHMDVNGMQLPKLAYIAKYQLIHGWIDSFYLSCST